MSLKGGESRGKKAAANGRSWSGELAEAGLSYPHRPQSFHKDVLNTMISLICGISKKKKKRPKNLLTKTETDSQT